MAFFKANGFYTGNTDSLGVQDQFPNDEKGGFHFSIQLPPAGAATTPRFLVLAVPAVQGVTGSVDCSIDQTANLVCAPDPMADAGRRKMFADIHLRAADAIGQVLVQMPGALDEVADTLRSRRTLRETFGKLDVNGDGRVSFADILSFDEGTGAFGKLLPAVQKDLQLGAGGEDFAELPGVSLGELLAPSRTHDTVSFTGGVREGASLLGVAASQLPAVQLAGFADGSVRPVESRRSPRDPALRFHDAAFFGGLVQVNPAITGNTRGWTAWTGLATVTDVDGDSLTGALIGLLRPGDTALHGIVIEQDGIGEFTGAPGTGRVSINWGHGFSGPFSATLQVTPFAHTGQR